jgi:hypothetical protein
VEERGLRAWWLGALLLVLLVEAALERLGRAPGWGALRRRAKTPAG